MNATLLAQAATNGGSDTAIVVAVITATGVVLAALVTVLGQRNTARLDAIEKNQAALASAIERLERRMEDGLARLTERVDRLYGGPTLPATSEDDPSRIPAPEILRSFREFIEQQLEAPAPDAKPFQVPDDLQDENDSGPEGTIL